MGPRRRSLGDVYRLRQAVELVVSHDPTELVIDLSELQVLGGAAARQVIAARRLVAPECRVVLRHTPSVVRTLFELTVLDSHCEIE